MEGGEMSGEKRPDEPEQPVAAPWTAQDRTEGDNAAEAGPPSANAPVSAAPDTDVSADPAPGKRDDAAEARIEDAETRDDPVWSGAEEARDDQAAAAAKSASTPAAPPPPPAKQRGGFAGTALTALVFLIGGGALAVWGGPKVAPMLPAPVAQWLQPAGAGLDMTAVEAAIEARLAALPDPAAPAASAAETAEQALSAVTAAGDRLADLSARIDDVAAQVAALEARPAGGGADPALAERMGALESALADMPAGGGLEAVRESVEQLRGEIEALETRIAGAADGDAVAAIDQRIAAVEARQAEVESAREQAMAAAQEAQADARLTAAKAAIDRAMALGEPFADALDDARASGAEVPEALVAAAASGAPTRERLKAEFAPAAYEAISAALQAEAADDGMLYGVLARFEARVTGLPAEPIEGDSAAAVLSRARAALLGGDIDAALAGIEALPPEAQAEMADWAEGAKLRRDAEAALSNWRLTAGAQ
jgi:hypothetical protein